MAFAHGSVVLAAAAYKRGLRPYLVVSNGSRPFIGDEYTVAVVTTRPRSDAVELHESGLTEGRLIEYPSYVNPWSLHVVQHGDIERRVAQVSIEVIEAVADGAYRSLRPLTP